MSLRDLVLDPWAALSYKKPLQHRSGRGTQLIGQPWLSETDRRRLTAYIVLEAYAKNRARDLLDDPEAEKDVREYGDAALIIRQGLSALLGRDQTIVVDGADKFDPDLEQPDDSGGEDEPNPDEPTEDTGPTPEELADNAAAGAAADRQEWLRGWARDEKFTTKMHATEETAVKLGDGVYLLAWSTAKQRARLTTMDPGFYFPVLPDTLFDDFPSRVHFAWEIEGDSTTNTPKKLRRITYELGAISGATDETVGPLNRLRRTLRINRETGAPEPQAGDQYDNERGAFTRRYPWQPAGEKPSTQTCYMTDATWLADQASDVYDLDASKATYAVNEEGQLVERLDLRIDFLPVVHEPNTPADAEHFGESLLSPVLQVLDDVSGGDTDHQGASATTGLPIIGVSGVSIDNNQRRYAPGEMWGLGETGKLSTVDTSSGLTALGNANKDRRDLLSVNSRLPGAFLGRIQPSEVPSGFALALGFTPLDSLVDELRLVRKEKYPLLFRMVQRFAMAGGQLPAGETMDADLLFGSYLPANVQEVIDQVTALRGATPPLISLQTAVGMLQDVGLPIDDVAKEIAAIEAADLPSANLLADATGDTDAVRSRLKLGPAPQTTPPRIVLPTPPTPPEPPTPPPPSGE